MMFFLIFIINTTAQSILPSESYTSPLCASSQRGFRERLDFVRVLIKLGAGTHINLKASCSCEHPKRTFMEQDRPGNRPGAGVSPTPHRVALQPDLCFTIFKNPINKIYGHH